MLQYENLYFGATLSPAQLKWNQSRQLSQLISSQQVLQSQPTKLIFSTFCNTRSQASFVKYFLILWISMFSSRQVKDISLIFFSMSFSIRSVPVNADSMAYLPTSQNNYNKNVCNYVKYTRNVNSLLSFSIEDLLQNLMVSLPFVSYFYMQFQWQFDWSP